MKTPKLIEWSAWSWNFFTSTSVSLAMLVAYAPSSAMADPSVPAVDPKVEQALLGEDWERVAVLLKDVDVSNPSPVLRLIKGHACLALNRNNESACLFLSVRDSNLPEVEQWSISFERRQGTTTAIAQYFRADALARQKRYGESLALLDSLLKQTPQDALGLNARGVVRVALTNYPMALLDFHAATMANPTFADAWCNLGTLALDQKEGARSAIKDFNRALAISSNFALALYGRGCLRLALHRSTEAEADLKEALGSSPCLSSTLLAAIGTAREFLAASNIQVASADGENPGTQLTATLQAINKGDLSALRSGLTQYANDSLNFGRIMDAAALTGKQHPALQEPILQTFRDVHQNAQMRGIFATVEHQFQSQVNLQGSLGQLAQIGGNLGYQQTRTYDFPGRLDLQQSTINQFGNALGRMSEHFPDPNPSGFDASQRNAVLDSAHWPFKSQYGLFFGWPTPGPSGTK